MVNALSRLRNSDIALIRQARGAPPPNPSASDFANLNADDIRYIAQLRGRQYNEKMGPLSNLREDDIAFIRQMAPQGITQPQRFTDSGSPYAGGPYWNTQSFTDSGSPYVGQPMGQPAAPTLDAVPYARNEGILNRLDAARKAKEWPGVNRGLDPSLPGNDPTAGPLTGPVNYDTVLGAPGMPRLSTPMTQDQIDTYNEANRPRVDEGIIQRVMRRMQGGPAPQPNQAGALAGAMIADGAPKVSPDQGSPYVGGPIPAGNPYLTNPQSGAAAMNDPNALTPALTGAQSNPFLSNPQSGAAAMGDPNAMTPVIPPGTNRPRGGGGGSASVPMPPPRPAEFGSQPALYSVDFGDGSPVRQYLAKDGKAPNIPGANVYMDTTYDPNAGALAKFIRGVF